MSDFQSMFKELLEIMNEEYEVLQDYKEKDDPTLPASAIAYNVRKAIRKIIASGPIAPLLPRERSAVRYSLEDVGTQYLDADDVIYEPEIAKKLATKAREQAATLGVYL